MNSYIEVDSSLRVGCIHENFLPTENLTMASNYRWEVFHGVPEGLISKSNYSLPIIYNHFWELWALTKIHLQNTHKLSLTCFYVEVCCRLRETLICLQNARLQVRNTFTPLAVTNQLTNVHINLTSFYLNNTYKPDNDLKLNTCPVLILPRCEKFRNMKM